MVLTIITIKTITRHHFSNNNFQIIRQQLNRLLNALQTYCMMLPLNLNPQLYATSALWANDSTKENITLAYSEIWLIIYKKERRGKRRGWVFFLREGGVRLGLAVEEGERLGFVMNLPVDTHPLQCRGFKLDMQETSATEVCVSAFSFFLREKGSAPRTCCWRGRRAPRTWTYDDLSPTTHPLQYRGLELDRQETSATEVCESSLSFYRLVLLWSLLHPF